MIRPEIQQFLVAVVNPPHKNRQGPHCGSLLTLKPIVRKRLRVGLAPPSGFTQLATARFPPELPNRIPKASRQAPYQAWRA